ncbi:MAG TPA: proprotein convertase P-domain-containing protein [Thermoanaerobaculia bacterium]|jgi:subtilisin-like proprotein convertase family protein
MRRLLAGVALLFTVSARAELRIELVRHSLTGTHCRYREYVDGIPSDDYVTRPCEASAAPQPFVARSSFLMRGRLTHREITRDRIAIDTDLTTGAVVRRIPLYYEAKPARVFDPNPVASLNDPSLQDRNDAASAVPPAAYRDVLLDDVIESGPLRGPWVALVDRQGPPKPPPDASGSLVFDREQDGFEDVNAYFHIDGSQRYLQSLGYSGARAIAPYAIETDAHATTADDSLFVPSQAQLGRGVLLFGEGGTDDAEDADLVVHEYGHAIQEWIAPGTFLDTFASESRAMSEGFGDYWAFSAHYATRKASGRDPFCLADWDARCWEDDASQNCGYAPGSNCLRRVDSPRTMATYQRGDTPGVEHANGQIWSSALREIFLAAGKRETDVLVLESLFDVPPRPTFAVMAARLLETDRLLYGGAHANAICAPMLARGILTNCNGTTLAAATHVQSAQHGLAIPENNLAGVTSTIEVTDARVIESVAVRVDIDHSARGDLSIQLIAPDGTTILLQVPSNDRTRDIHVTYGVDAAPAGSFEVLRGRSAAGVWQLRVADVHPLDTGILQSWGLVFRFAGDPPPPARPRAARTQMIPVVAHLYGAGITPFASDVRLSNVTSAPVTATLIFTRGETFTTLDVPLAAGQTAAFDDVLQSAFNTTGSGSLEVLGDVVVNSRTYALTPAGTIGSQVPPVRDTTALGEAPLVARGFPSEPSRNNAGIVETGGGSGIIRINGATIAIGPFEQLQLPVDATEARFEVVSGTARIGGYLSQLDASGDALFIPAVERPREGLAPAIGTSAWRSDLWGAGAFRYIHEGISVTRELAGAYVDVVSTAFASPGTAGAITGAGDTRIVHDGTTQYAPFLTSGNAEQHLSFIETVPPYRTNIGFVSDGAATAEAIVYDGAGVELARYELATASGLAQAAVLVRVAGGRAVVRFTSGRGAAYASLIDTRSGDATFFAAR